MATYKELIINLFQRDNRTYRAYEIAQNTKIPIKSIYSVLSRMVKEGLLNRPQPTLYQANQTIGVDDLERPWRVQNLRWVAESMDGCRLVVPCDLDYLPYVGYVRELVLPGLGLGVDDEVRLRFQIGSVNRKLTFTVCAPLGLDLYGFQLVGAWLDQQCRDHGFTGVVDWRVDRHTEILRDLSVYDMDGLGAKFVSRSDYEGWMEKVYLKEYGKVRQEFKVPVTSVESIEAILKGGLSTGQLFNASVKSLQNQETAINVMRGMVGGNYEMRVAMERKFNGFIEAFMKMTDEFIEMKEEFKILRGES